MCRSLHGQIFTISTQVESLLNLLRVSDPKELKGMAPFPKQNKIALQQLAVMSKEQIVQNGWDLPPSHPLCRCILVPVGTVPAKEITGPAGLKIPNVRLNTTFAESAEESAQIALQGDLAAQQANIMKNAKDTGDIYKHANGQWTKGRQVVHNDIIDKTTDGLVAQEEPVFHMMGGGTASGKSSAVNAGKVKFPNGHAFIDADEIKAGLPEYNAMIASGDARAASFVHAESSFVSDQIMKTTSQSRFHTVLDGTGDGGLDKLSRRVNRFRDQGYKISADYVNADLDVAIQRAATRAAQTGRAVPESVIREIHEGVSTTFKQAVDVNLFDDVRLWDTTAGGTPRLVFSMENGVQTIHDEALWLRFLSKANTSEDVYKTAAGNWTAERAALHQKIVKDVTGDVAKVADGEEKVFHMMGGGPAAGKSSVINNGSVKLPKSHVAVDADDIKGRLPDYRQMLDDGNSRAASFVHAESSAVSEMLMQTGVDDGLAVVLDGTGDGGYAKLARRVNRFKNEGYKIKADYVTIPTDEAVARATSRAAQTGRKVPDSVIRETHAGVSRDFKRAVDEGLFDEVRLWDNTGSEPVLVFSMEDGVQTVHNQGLWQQFLAKGSE